MSAGKECLLYMKWELQKQHLKKACTMKTATDVPAQVRDSPKASPEAKGHMPLMTA